jgi:HAD superfamily hydrolase (TIGR01549 family)
MALKIPNQGIRTILFDLDDTLIGSEQIYQAIYHVMGLEKAVFEKARAGVKAALPEGHVAARNRLLYFKKYLELQGQFSADRALQLNATYETLLQKLIAADLEQTQQTKTLEALAKHFRLGIVTNENLRTQLLKLHEIDPHQKLFSFMVTSEEMGVEKPAAGIIKEALLLAKANPEEILMVGDSIDRDLEPFQQAGCFCLGTRQFRDESKRPNSFQWLGKLEELRDGLSVAMLAKNQRVGNHGT